MNKIYLAMPYTKLDHEFVFRESCRVAAYLIKIGNIVFSPITHAHYIAKFYNLPTDAKFWWEQNEPYLDWCDQLWVLQLDGWEESRGVYEEIKYAKRKGKSIHYLLPNKGKDRL